MDAKEAGVVYDRIEDAIVQADEVDGKMLQVSNHPTKIISPCALSVDFNSSLPNTVKKALQKFVPREAKSCNNF